jgi:hypothetical protein
LFPGGLFYTSGPGVEKAMSHDDVLRLVELVVAAILIGVVILRRKHKSKSDPKDI